ncbi:MAG: hypothetical protein ACEPOZ_05565 [Marinifilaceae bacterium]
MKQSKHILFYLCTLLLLSSCNYYESEVPITSSSEASIDSSLLGQWILTTEKKEDRIGGYVEIIPFNDHEHLIQLVDYQDSTTLIKSIENIRMFTSTINKRTYFNIQMLEKSGRSNYLIFRTKAISRHRLKLFYLSKDLFQKKFDRQKHFEEYIEDHQKEFDSYFQLEGILVRKPEQ